MGRGDVSFALDPYKNEEARVQCIASFLCADWSKLCTLSGGRDNAESGSIICVHSSSDVGVCI